MGYRYAVLGSGRQGTAMERTTGWHAAIMAGFIARQQTPRGSVPVELAVPGPLFVEEFRKRGFDLHIF